MADRLSVRDALLSFVPSEPLRAALFLTYSFDGRWFEEAFVPDLCERPIATMLVVRDRNAIVSEAPSARYRRANACRSSVFHPKLVLLVTENRARAVIGSANLTRGGFERQLELGRVFDLEPESPEHRELFTSLLKYLADGLSTELHGASAQDLREIARALEEAVAKHGRSLAPVEHELLHNYERPIWSQILDRVPHRVLRRAVVVSPFFEPDRKRPEDPALGASDSSIFQRLLFDDFEFDAPKGEPALRVFFRQSEGRTELPVRKLRELTDRVAFLAQDEREQRLHAKLLLLEGAEGPSREPFLLAVHGSPNFTTAGLLNRPPHGNSELAVLTTLPVTRKGLNPSVSALGLDRGFTRVHDLSSLTSEPGGEPPSPPSGGVVDVTLRVADEVLILSFLEATPENGRVRVRLLRDGAWSTIGEAAAPAATELEVKVVGLLERDVHTKLLELRGTTVRVEILDASGVVVVTGDSPVNVDIPADFCGTTLVGSALLTLDERIARAGLGVPPTYREQQKWIEAQRAALPAATGPAVSSHQADLDRFYRNVHTGLKGILARCKAAPGSEFTARRSVDELTRWGVEATSSDDASLTRECRLYLVGRLLRALDRVMEGTSPALKERLPELALGLGTSERLASVASWLDAVGDPNLAAYATEPKATVRRLSKALGKGKASNDGS